MGTPRKHRESDGGLHQIQAGSTERNPVGNLLDGEFGKKKKQFGPEFGKTDGWMDQDFKVVFLLGLLESSVSVSKPQNETPTQRFLLKS